MKRYINPYNLFVGSFIPNWLLRRGEISPGAKLCYARLAQFAGKDGECFPAQATLASEIGSGERQIRRYLSELEEEELIHSIHVGLNQPNRYRFLWHPWMEEGKGLKKESPDGRGKGRPDRTHMSTPERTNMSCQERPYTSPKENQTRDSFKKTTTKDVVVDVEKIEKVKRTLAPCYLEMPDTVIAYLIEKKGIEYVLSIADKTAHQLSHKSKTPENPTGHFIALTLQGMNTPQGYQSPEEKAQAEKALRARAAQRRRESKQGQEERIPRETVKKFIKSLGGGKNDEAPRFF